MNKLSSLKKYVINMKIRRKVLLIFLLVGVLPFLCYIIFSNRYTNQIMLERETSLTESALQQAVQSVENKLETYNNLSNYMFNNTSILQALNTEYSKDYFRMYKAYQDTIEPLFQTYYALHPGLENITIYSSCDLHPLQRLCGISGQAEGEGILPRLCATIISLSGSYMRKRTANIYIPSAR